MLNTTPDQPPPIPTTSPTTASPRTVAALLIVAVMTLCGCAFATSGGAVVTGFVYSNYSTGGVVGQGTASKRGRACASSVLGLFAFGDASIRAAKENGQITQVEHVDHYAMSILTFYAQTCTLVIGQ